MADYISTLTGQQMDASLLDMAQHNSEAYAVGTRDGIDVGQSDPTYHNNSKYWATIAGDIMEGAGIEDPNDDGNLVVKLPGGDSESWAVRTDVAQTLSEAQKSQARANISAGSSNRNLLLNPFFTVNQRGAASYTASQEVRTLDRWCYTLNTLGTGTITVSDNGLTIANGYASGKAYFKQYLDSDMRAAVDGQTITMSVLYQNGTVKSGTGEFHLGTTLNLMNSDGEIGLRIYSPNTGRADATIDIDPSKTIAIRAVKLELGAYSTIANDTFPNYGEELERCKYYFERITCGASHTLSIGFADAGDTTHLYLPIKCSPKRVSPTASYSGTIKYGRGNMSSSPSITAISTDQYDTASGYGTLQLTGTSLTTGNAYRILLASGAYIELLAEI